MAKIQQLIQQIANNSLLLQKVTPREFEEIVAELLASLGWEISLTQSTGDGGYDILGVSKEKLGLESTWIIECKRYNPRHKLGIEVVQNLYGVKYFMNVSNALLVTTSTFTKGASQFAASKYDLQLVDYERVIEWINQYEPLFLDQLYLNQRRFYTCFISYSHKDETFAETLTAKLRQEGIRVWFAAEDLLPGKKIYEEIDKALNITDKLIILLSKDSMKSEWVITEIKKARKREINESRRILFPIGLVSIEEIKQWECFDAGTGKDLAVELREYLIPDFSDWHNSRYFEQQLQKLLRGLETEA